MKTILVIIGVLLAAGCSYGEVPGNAATATFVVHCYTVGEHALEGKPGVLSVRPGWLNFREVDRVVYDPEKTNVEKMEKWLKEAGTYVKTIDDESGTGAASDTGR